MAIIPGEIESISAVKRKDWFFHAVLVVEWTDVAFCLSFVARKPLNTKKSCKSYEKIPILTTRRS